MKRLSEITSQQMYQRSASPRAPENSFDNDWLSGYFIGCIEQDHTEFTSNHHPITVEWNARGRPNNVNKRFKSFKAGYWAGVFNKIDEGLNEHHRPEKDCK